MGNTSQSSSAPHPQPVERWGKAWRFYQSLNPVYRNFATSIGLFYALSGGGAFSDLGWSLKDPMTMPRHIVVLAAVLTLTALATAAELELRWSGASKLLVKYEAEIRSLEAQVQQARPHHPKFDDVLPLSLDLMLDGQHAAPPVNHVVLYDYSMICKMVGSGQRFDVEAVVRMKGQNLAKSNLTELLFPIAGDHLVSLAGLQPKVYDLTSDSQRRNPKSPRLKSHHDGLLKDLALLFESPGVGQYMEFDIEFRYTWPSIFNCLEDYWFIDNTLFEGDTRKLTIELDATAMQPSDVVAYSYNRVTKVGRNCGRIQASSGSIYRFSTNTPERDTYYALCAYGGKCNQPS